MGNIMTTIKPFAVYLACCYPKGKENNEPEYLNKTSKKETAKDFCFSIIIV